MIGDSLFLDRHGHATKWAESVKWVIENDVFETLISPYHRPTPQLFGLNKRKVSPDRTIVSGLVV